MKKIAICVCIWRRYSITRIVFNYYKKIIKELKNEVEIQVFVVGSERNTSKKIAQEVGFNYREFPNLPLSEKQNFCVLFAKEWSPDGIVFIGSDDVLDKKIFSLYLKFLETTDSKNNILGFLDMYFYVKRSVRYLKDYPGKNKGRTVGAGRFFSKAVLDTIDWKPWRKLVNSGLDSTMEKTLIKYNIGIKTIRLNENKCYMIGLDCEQGLSSKRKKREALPVVSTNILRILDLEIF